MIESRQRVLCTGAAGFIGSHLVRALSSRGDEVWGLLGPGDELGSSAAPEVRWIRGDLARPETLSPLHRPFDTVYHLAALLTSDRADRFFSVNFEGTRNLVDAVLEEGRPRRLVFTSSLAAAGPATRASGRTEDDPCCPVCAYGRSKRMAELYLKAVSNRLPSTIVRLPLVYGPGSHGGLFAYFRMVRMRCCLVAGETVALTLGYVDDIVRGLMLLADSEASAGATYFLGDPRPYRVPEIVAAIEAALGTRALRVRIPYLLGYWAVAAVEAAAAARGRGPTVTRQDVRFLRFPYWTADTTGATRDLGFRTSVPLAEGVRMAADWYLSRGEI
jgi:dihydroflavonol-4-reductase